MKWYQIIVISLILSGIVGCSGYLTRPPVPEPNTPSVPAPVYVLTDKGEMAMDVAAAGAETLSAAASGVALYWPPAALLAGLFGGAAGAIRKIKPKLQKAETQSTHFYQTVEQLVFALKEYGEDHPEGWSTVEEHLRNFVGPSSKAIIRVIRGLPPKA